jgi:hypothetical protein
MYPLPLGARGLWPGKIFKLQMNAGEFKLIFHTKIDTLTPAFMPVNFGKVPNTFDFQRLATEDAGKNRHEALKKL